MKLYFLLIISLFYSTTVLSQDSLLVNLISENHKTFEQKNDNFYGSGWNYIESQIKNSKHTLVGEDHFSQEIPRLIRAIYDTKTFNNFFIEIDPYSTSIIEKSLKEFSDKQRQSFNEEYSELFSFYSFEEEYELLKHISGKGTNLMGSDQIVAYADRLIFNDLILKSQNEEAKEIYREISKRSREELERFYKETKNPMTMYFFTEEFLNKLSILEEMSLSHFENEVIDAMKKSVKIYKEQNHFYRVRLILNQLMHEYPKWNSESTLFKYGANHLTRGESFLGNYDIGNVVANITESNFEETFHIMVIGECGQLGSIFKIFPPKTVDKEKDFYLSYLKPFFNQTSEGKWHVFNLKPLRKQLLKGKLKVDNLNLQRVIRGYDALVIIPEVTPAGLMNSD